jgi:colicin import membrane protein
MSSKPRSYKISFIIAFGLHVIVFVFLLTQLKLPAQLPSLPENNTPIIHATAVNQQQLEQTLSKLKASEQRKKRDQLEQVKKLQQQRAEVAKLKSQQEKLKLEQLQQERLQQAKLQALKEQQQAEQQKLAIVKKQAIIAKQQQIHAARQAKQKAIQAAKQKEQLSKQKQLAVQKQADAQKQKDIQKQDDVQKQKDDIQKQDEADDLLQKQLASEQQQLTSARTHYVAGELDKYKSLILNAIGQQWLIPDGSNKELSATLLIRLAPGGMVLNVQVEKSSGDPALDHSAVTAVYKASPLPVPSDTSLFNNFRELSLTVRPENIIEG